MSEYSIPTFQPAAISCSGPDGEKEERMNNNLLGSTLRHPAQALCLCGILLSGAAGAVTTWNEIGDAGSLPATAQSTTVTDQTFDEIKGTLTPSAGDAQDLYRIFITGGGDFSATTTGGVAFDTELFLLDANGKGVYSNDDTNTFLAPSILPANTALTPVAAGFYYLGITQCCNQPVSAGGPIFVGLGGGADHLIVGGPTGPGGASPITGYSGAFDQTPGGGAYTIFLTGAQLAPPPVSAVPEPETYALMLAGLASMCLWARRRRSH
jgi:hypothetical protein